MSTHAARPAVDVAPSAPARPGLALALALLSIPGVTITWDLSGVAGFAGTGHADGHARDRRRDARGPVRRLLPDRRGAGLSRAPRNSTLRRGGDAHNRVAAAGDGCSPTLARAERRERDEVAGTMSGCGRP